MFGFFPPLNNGSGGPATDLTMIGDVSATGPLSGPISSIVNTVGGKTAAEIAKVVTAALETNATVLELRSFEGDDATATGSPLFPFKTLNAAQAFISGNDATKPYLIRATGVFTETNWSPLPNVTIDGQSSTTLTVTNPVTLDASFVSNGGTASIKNIEVDFQGGLNFVFGNTTTPVIMLDNIRNISTTAWTIEGDDEAGAIAVISNNYGYNGGENWTIKNCYGAMSNCAPNTLTVSSESDTLNFSFSVIDNKILGSFLVDNTGPSNFSVDMNSNNFLSTAVLKSSSSGAVSVLNSNAYFGNTLTLDSTNVTLNTDLINVTPLYDNGATSVQVTYRTIIPSAAPSFLFTSETGVDAPGRGSILSPFATVSYAMSTITAGSGTVFVCALSSSFEPDIAVKPNTGIISLTQGVLAYTSLTLSDADWTGTNGAEFYLSNISINSINFDFSFFDGSNGGNPKIFTNNAKLLGSFLLDGGDHSAVNYFGSGNYVTGTTAFRNRINSFTSLNNYYRLDFNGGITTPLGIVGTIASGFFSQADYFGGNINLKAPDTVNQLICEFRAPRQYPTITSFTLEGNQLFVYMDNTAYSQSTISIIGGTPEIRFLDNADGVLAGFTPTAYTALSARVKGHLEGINNKLNAMISLASTQVAFATGTNQLGGDAAFTYNNSTKILSFTSGGIKVPTTGGTPSTLDFYEEFNMDFTMLGVYSLPGTLSVKFVRVGKVVTMKWDVMEATVASIGNNFVSSVGVPARFAPDNSTTHSWTVPVFDGTGSGGYTSSGVISIGIGTSLIYIFNTVTTGSGGTFDSTYAGIAAGSITYAVP